jgi:hypothetical protein
MRKRGEGAYEEEREGGWALMAVRSRCVVYREEVTDQIWHKRSVSPWRVCIHITSKELFTILQLDRN